MPYEDKRGGDDSFRDLEKDVQFGPIPNEGGERETLHLFQPPRADQMRLFHQIIYPFAAVQSCSSHSICSDAEKRF